MKRTVLLGILLLAATAPLCAAQLYRWVDEKGNVEWRDTPPPATAKKVEQRRIGTSTIQTGDLPYSVQQAVKNFPVTLWVTNCGDTCDKARAHLNRRGVPYAEKDPQSDLEGFKKVSGGGLEVPLLFVGSARFKGYHEIDWDAALDIAGYPKTALAPVKPQPKTSPTPAPKAAPSETASVRLFTDPQCGADCVSAKALLASRGISFREIVVESPPQIEELKQLSGDTYVPVLAVGRFIVQGFSPADYHRVLDQSGFRRDQEAARP